jgi:hypothetical protein
MYIFTKRSTDIIRCTKFYQHRILFSGKHASLIVVISKLTEGSLSEHKRCKQRFFQQKKCQRESSVNADEKGSHSHR